MSRLIDADALVKDGYVLHRTYQQDEKTMVYETKRIEDVPTIEPERKVGKWIFVDGFTKCSECGYRPKLSSGGITARTAVRI